MSGCFGLLPLEDGGGQEAALKGMAQQIFALPVDVDLFRRVDAHDIPDKLQIPKGHPCLHAVGGDAPVRPEDVVHVQLPDALLALPLEGLRGYRDMTRVEQVCGDDLETVCANIREKLIRGVEKRLDADVPVGFLLSGGLDSSLAR